MVVRYHFVDKRCLINRLALRDRVRGGWPGGGVETGRCVPRLIVFALESVVYDVYGRYPWVSKVVPTLIKYIERLKKRGCRDSD